MLRANPIAECKHYLTKKNWNDHHALQHQWSLSKQWCQYFKCFKYTICELAKDCRHQCVQYRSNQPNHVPKSMCVVSTIRFGQNSYSPHLCHQICELHEFLPTFSLAYTSRWLQSVGTLNCMQWLSRDKQVWGMNMINWKMIGWGWTSRKPQWLTISHYAAIKWSNPPNHHLKEIMVKHR